MPPWWLPLRQVDAAKQHGVKFEVAYSNAIKGARRDPLDDVPTFPGEGGAL